MKVQVHSTSFHSEGEKIQGHFVTPKGAGPFPGICKYHGLPGSSDQVSGVASQLAKAGFAVLTFNFRGFRTSEGLFSLAGEIKDASTAITHLLDCPFILDDWTGVYGPSYGGAIAILAAARDPRIRAVSLRAPVFDTLEFAQSPVFELGLNELLHNAPQEMHGLTDSYKRKLILDRLLQESKVFNPMNEIAKIAPRPLFIITGDADQGIPVDGVQRLFSQAQEPKELVIIKGADHNLSTPRSYKLTIDAVVDWFKRQAFETT
ncbi:MAG: alpha/beta hydrolase [Candidatus Thorarchaeota archaeon]